MKYYTEITLINDIYTLHELWASLYLQVHFSLVNASKKEGVKSIGVSFPRYFLSGQKRHLGNKLRIFAPTKEILFAFLQDLSLRLDTYFPDACDCYHTKNIKEVPDEHTYICYHIKRDRASKEKLARRMTKRHQLTYQEAMDKLADYEPKLHSLPFIMIKSHSTDEYFRLYIEKSNKAIRYPAENQEFNTYGIGGFVPEF